MPVQWDIVYLKVENEVFPAHRQGFTQHSSVFEDMFLVGDSSVGEGKSADNPIVLDGYEAADFEALHAVLYPKLDDVVAGKFSLTREQWIGVLRLSRPWQMEKIYKLAIKALSGDSFSLTAVDKVTLGRDHKVASWLIDGLAELVSSFTEISLDDLEQGVGLQTAYRVAGIRLKAKPSDPTTAVTSIGIDGLQCSAFSLTSLHCGFCAKPLVVGDLACHSCSKSIEHARLGTTYVAPNVTTSSVSSNTAVGGHCFYLYAQHIKCASCNQSALTPGFTCPACHRAHTWTTNLYLAMFSSPPAGISSHSQSASDLIRDAFRSEIEECEL